MATFKGPDLSVHNGKVNMASVKNSGCSFVIIREGYGNEYDYPGQKDVRFEENYKNAKAVGLSVGCYHYMYATSVEEAKKEAKGMLNNLKGKKFELPVALDIEDPCQINLPNSTIEEMIKAFIDILEKAGYYVMLYSYEAFLTSKMSASFRSKYDIWCANISSTPNIKYGIHQYTFTGKISGVTGNNGNVDMNKTTIDYKKLITEKGFNGFPKPIAKPSNKILDEKGLKKGDRNISVLAYKQLLLIAYTKKIVSEKVANDDGFGNGTLRCTNELLKKFGYKETGIVGDNLIKKLADAITKK